MNCYPLIRQGTRFDTVIVANGTFPEGAVALDVIHHAQHIIACDGGAEMLIVRGIEPRKITVAGDGDSITPTLKERLHFIQVDEQNDNDLTKATRYVAGLPRMKGATVAYLAATGKREDHTMANISLLMRYYQEFDLHPVMLTDYGYFIPTCMKSRFETFARQQVSIFNFGCKRLESEGLVWNTRAFDSLWQGTLNEAQGNHVCLHGDSFYLVYLTLEEKIKR